MSLYIHTVLYFIKNDLSLRILRFPGYFETPGYSETTLDQ